MVQLKKIRSVIIGVLLIGTGMTFHSCISPYESDIESEPELISIDCSLIKGEEEQTVQVSKTASLLYSRIIPVGGCNVSLLDEFDNQYSYTEKMKGTYSANIPDEELILGRHYKIRVITGEGDVYESDYEMLNNGVEVDSVYFAVEDRVDVETGEPYSGIQFYLDVKAQDEESRYFRWRLEETFEYTSFGPISYYYMDESHTPVLPEDPWALFRCWKRGEVEGLFQSSNMNLTQNEKKRIPLQYVSDQTERLRIKYSLLVNQYTLNKNAYDYFEQNRIATEESDGLYTRQPRQPITNFHNVNFESERVLGYFWVSTKTSKRIFVSKIEDMDVKPELCSFWDFDPVADGEGPFPIYIYEDIDMGRKYVSTIYCFDCSKRGGSTIRPDYWE